MKIKIISACKVRGAPANAGDVIKVDDVSANYLILIGKAIEINTIEPQDEPLSDGAQDKKTVETARPSKTAEPAVAAEQEAD